MSCFCSGGSGYSWWPGRKKYYRRSGDSGPEIYRAPEIYKPRKIYSENGKASYVEAGKKVTTKLTRRVFNEIYLLGFGSIDVLAELDRLDQGGRKRLKKRKAEIWCG